MLPRVGEFSLLPVLERDERKAVLQETPEALLLLFAVVVGLGWEVVVVTLASLWSTVRFRL